MLEASGHSVLRACSSGRKSQPTPSPCQRLQAGLSPQGKSLGVMAKSQAEGPQQTAGNQQLQRILQFSIPGSGSRSSAGRLTVRWFFREGECLRRGALDPMWNPGGGVCPEDKGTASHGSCRWARCLRGPGSRCLSRCPVLEAGKQGPSLPELLITGETLIMPNRRHCAPNHLRQRLWAGSQVSLFHKIPG